MPLRECEEIPVERERAIAVRARKASRAGHSLEGEPDAAMAARAKFAADANFFTLSQSRDGEGRPPAASVLVLSGLDPSGHSGLQADLRHLARHEVLGLGIPTCFTLQTKDRFLEVRPIPAADVAAALDLAPRTQATKIGALHRADIVRAIASALQRRDDPVVLDPVLGATHGGALLDAEGRGVLMDELLPRLSLLTPNQPELMALVPEAKDCTAAGEALIDRGLPAILVKGGHAEPLPGGEIEDRLLLRGDAWISLRSPRIAGPTPRGTGCALATLIALRLARGVPLLPAIEAARLELRRLWFAARAAERAWI